MIPGFGKIDPKKMHAMMDKMGIKQEPVDDAKRVIIEKDSGSIVIESPSVTKVNMQGNETWQIVGEAEERELESTPSIDEEDIQTVVEQTGVSEEKAREMIEKHDGDLAAAVMELQNS